MISLRKCLLLAIVGLMGTALLRAQEPPKPGPEHEMLKKYVGNWDATMKMGGMDSKCSATYKMELGGLWLMSSFEGEVFGVKFQGHGMDTYDAGKKKFVSVWCDSMTTSPMVMEGTMDSDKKLTMTGEMPGPDGKMAKHKSVTVWKDADTIQFDMFAADMKEPMFTIIYKRKK